MGDDHERDAQLALDGFQLDLHLLAEFEVQGAQRLVEQQYPGAPDQRPGQRHPLLLAAGQLCGLAAGLISQADHLQRLSGAPPAFVLGHAFDQQAVFDVLRDAHMRKQGVVLKDRIGVPAGGR